MLRSDPPKARLARSIRVACGWPAALTTWALWLAVGLGQLGPHGWVFELFPNFMAQYMALFALCVVALAIARWRRTAIVAVLGVAFTTATMAPYFHEPASTASAGQHRIRLVTFNAWFRNDDLGRTADFLRASDADLVVLQEIHRGSADMLARLLPAYSHRVAIPTSRGYGLAIFSKWPMQAESLQALGVHRIARASVSWRDTPIVLFGAHLSWPLGRRAAAARARELNVLAATAASVAQPVLVVGDFNLTPWSRYFERFVERSGLTDCAIGQGMLPTWPAQFMPARIRIDHCFASGHWRVQRIAVGPALGSDHLPVIVDLALLPRANVAAE